MELSFRTLKAEEIDVRVGQTTYNEKTKGCSLLLYKDARVDMALLDEVCKPFGWCREHKELKGVCYCGVGIKDTDTGEWIYKWDAGAESFSDKEKGEASDSFKRACVNWGIGRELYTAGFIWVNLSENDFYYDDKERKWKMQKNIKFSVKEIHIDEKRQIDKLVIVDQRGAVCYQFPKQASGAPKAKSNVIIPNKEEKPAEATKQAKEEDIDDDDLILYSNIAASITLAQLKENVAMALGKSYENQVRKNAAMRGVDIAQNAEEIKDAYALIQDRPGYEEVKEYSIKVAKQKGWLKK